MTKNIEELIEKVKNGMNPFGNLTFEELEILKEIFQKDIAQNQKQLDIIKEKIKLEKKKLDKNRR